MVKLADFGSIRLLDSPAVAAAPGAVFWWWWEVLLLVPCRDLLPPAPLVWLLLLLLLLLLGWLVRPSKVAMRFLTLFMMVNSRVQSITVLRVLNRSNRPTHTHRITRRETKAFLQRTVRVGCQPPKRGAAGSTAIHSYLLYLFIFSETLQPFFANQVLLFFVLPFTTRSTWRGFANRDRERAAATISIRLNVINAIWTQRGFVVCLEWLEIFP